MLNRQMTLKMNKNANENGSALLSERLNKNRLNHVVNANRSALLVFIDLLIFDCDQILYCVIERFIL
jgi:hypothetical protein